MTGLENITKKILNDAKEKEKLIINEANIQAQKIIDNALQEIKEKQLEIKLSAEQNAKLKAQRIIAATQLDGKKEYLSAKQEKIEDVFVKSASSLSSLDDAAYDALIKSLSAGIDGEIIMLPRDKENGTGGGFIVKNDKIEYNFSFEALVKNARAKLEKDIVSMLFG